MYQSREPRAPPRQNLQQRLRAESAPSSGPECSSAPEWPAATAGPSGHQGEWPGHKYAAAATESFFISSPLSEHRPSIVSASGLPASAAWTSCVDGHRIDVQRAIRCCREAERHRVSSPAPLTSSPSDLPVDFAESPGKSSSTGIADAGRKPDRFVADEAVATVLAASASALFSAKSGKASLAGLNPASAAFFIHV